MPTYSFTIAAVLLLVISLPTSAISLYDWNSRGSHAIQAAVPVSGLRRALLWLDENQSSDGSYGGGLYVEHWTAAASYALWINDTHSPKAVLSYSWLATSIDSSSNWFWTYGGESDIPGSILYSVAASGNLHLIQLSTVQPNLLQLQESNGGFRGYYDTAISQSVTSSVDTAEAVRGLVNAGAINASSLGSAVNYLFTLQNPDGSFNLTKSTPNAPLYSLGPEPVSITALILLALRDASYTGSDPHVSKALNLLTAKSSRGFAVAANDTNSVYAASLSALAFNAFGRSSDALAAVSFILSHQNPDGGFRDSIRGSGGSNALDTGWAAIALQRVGPGPVFSPFLRSIVILGVVVGVGALVVVVGVAVYLVRRGRIRTIAPTP